MENKKTFRERLTPYFSPKDCLDMHLAYILAKFGHRAQTRKEIVNGKPLRYFEHVRRVALILIDELKIIDKDMIMAALLHDTFEDTDDITPEIVEHSFGKECCRMVSLLSKVPKEGYHERLSNCNDWKVLTLKMCDRLDNLRSLIHPETTIEFQKRQIKETVEIYYPLFDFILDLCPKNHFKTILSIRDEIRRLIEKYQTIIEIKEKEV